MLCELDFEAGLKGSANDYDYVNGDPCNSLDLSGEK